MTPFTKKGIFKMKLRDEPIFIDCIELDLGPGKWATKEMAELLRECGVFEFDELGDTVCKHEIHSRVFCSMSKKERVLKIVKGQVLSRRLPEKS